MSATPKQTAVYVRYLYTLNNDLPAPKFVLNERMLLRQGKNIIAAVVERKNKAPEDVYEAQEMALTYFQICSLITQSLPYVTYISLEPNEAEFVEGAELWSERRKNLSQPDAANRKITDRLYENFLIASKKLFQKYYDVIMKFKFLKTALDYSFRNKEGSKYDSVAFIDAWICLEALFNEGSGDITHKIAHRLAFILNFDGFEPITTFRNAKKLYTMRNDIVHGRQGRPESKYISLVSSYARRSCICFLILCRNRLERGASDIQTSLIREIDEAMLDMKKRRMIQREITRGLKNFELLMPLLIDESQYHALNISK